MKKLIVIRQSGYKFNSPAFGIFLAMGLMVFLWAPRNVSVAHADTLIGGCDVADYTTDSDHYGIYGAEFSASGTCYPPANTIRSHITIVMDDGGPVYVNGGQVWNIDPPDYYTCVIKNANFDISMTPGAANSLAWTTYNSPCAGEGARVHVDFYGSSCVGNAGNSCTSSANACGQTNSGSIQCDGSCSASTPSNPSGYGNSCTSSANICGQTNSGTIQCNGSCSASAPADSACPAPSGWIRCNGASSCTISYGGSGSMTWQTANTTSCSVAPTGWSGVTGSNSTGALYTDATYTLTCQGQNGSPYTSQATVTVSAPSVTIQANGSGGSITVPWNSNVNLTWSSSNAASCTKSGDWSGSVTPNVPGSQQTGNLSVPKTYAYSITCSGNGSTQATSFVTVSPPIPTASNVTESTNPDYCSAGPNGTITWTFDSGAGLGSPQASYQVQVAPNGNFASPVYDSGQINSNSTSFAIPNGILQFNTTYQARVRVWNVYGGVSSWANSNSWTTPPYAWPQTAFIWAPHTPGVNSQVQFTDQTVFGGGSPGARTWSWDFGDGGSSTQQNPQHTYLAQGNYIVDLTATDAAGQTCSKNNDPGINVQKPIPQIKEVAPVSLGHSLWSSASFIVSRLGRLGLDSFRSAFSQLFYGSTSGLVPQ